MNKLAAFKFGTRLAIKLTKAVRVFWGEFEMLRRKTKTFAFTIAVFALSVASAQARSVRVDSGDWDNSGFSSVATSTAIGFDFSMLGVTASTAQINTDGSVVLSGSAETVQLNPFFEAAQTAGGNTVQFQYGTTNAAFATAGVDAGFRAEWQVRDAAGTLLNEFQIALFDLSNGQYALEFNYNQLTFGDDGSQIGYSTSLGDDFDLPDELGLTFADYMGIGDDFTNNCANAPNALACNNYFANTGDFGSGVTVLPDLAGGFFRQIDSNGDPVQGRYLWIFGDASTIPEPSTLVLLALGVLAFAGRRRKR